MTQAPKYLEEVNRLQRIGQSPAVEVRVEAQPSPMKVETPYTKYDEPFRTDLTAW